MHRLHLFITALLLLLLLPPPVPAVVPAKVPYKGKGHGFLSNLNGLYPPPTGDWLTSTYCYCHSPVRARENWKYEKAHIFQHEYYNYHSNVTFVADHMCLSRARKERDQCIRPNVGGDNDDWPLDQHRVNNAIEHTGYMLANNKYICKKFPRTEEEMVAQANSVCSTRKVKRYGGYLPVLLVCTIHCSLGLFEPDPKFKSSHVNYDNVCFAVTDHFYGSQEFAIRFNRQKRKMKHEGDQGRVKTPFQEVRGYCEDMCMKNFNMPVDMEIDDPKAQGGSRQYVYTKLDDMCDNCR